MKALSLLQPWATLIILGYKHCETRSWPTKHRGQLAIHASKGKPAHAREVCATDPYISEILQRHDLTFDTLPRGVILGSCQVDSMHQVDENFDLVLDDLELACGDYSNGRWVWALSNVIRLTHPFPANGTLGLWKSPLLGQTKPLLLPGRQALVSGHVHRFGGETVTLLEYHHTTGWLCQTSQGWQNFQAAELI